MNNQHSNPATDKYVVPCPQETVVDIKFSNIFISGVFFCPLCSFFPPGLLVDSFFRIV